MFKVDVINNINSRTFSAQFDTEAEADAFIAKQEAKEGWGRNGRQVYKNEEEYDLSLVLSETTIDVDGVSKTLVALDKEYDVTKTDITAEAQKIADKALMRSAREFGLDLIDEISAENRALGITADGMTSTVLTLTAKVVQALSVGSLKAAMDELALIDAGSYDVKYITAARLLEIKNKIETFLGITLSTEL